MKYPSLSSKDTKIIYFHNIKAGYKQAFIFIANIKPLYVMAKSVVKGVIEKDYPYRSDPYIYKIKKSLPNDVLYYKITDTELLKKVWDRTTGNYSAVTFVKVDALLLILSEVFPELGTDALLSLKNQLHGIEL